MENQSEALINKFYEAFARLDEEAMVACYHNDIVFEDPAFGVLKGAHAGNMWRMLCASQKGKDFQVTIGEIQANEAGGSAHWEALYVLKNRKKGAQHHQSAV